MVGCVVRMEEAEVEGWLLVLDDDDGTGVSMGKEKVALRSSNSRVFRLSLSTWRQTRASREHRAPSHSRIRTRSRDQWDPPFFLGCRHVYVPAGEARRGERGEYSTIQYSTVPCTESRSGPIHSTEAQPTPIQLGHACLLACLPAPLGHP